MDCSAARGAGPDVQFESGDRRNASSDRPGVGGAERALFACVHNAGQLLDDSLARTASLLITMGCGEACPVVPGVERDDWALEDPKGKPLARVREIRDEVRDRVRTLIAARGW